MIEPALSPRNKYLHHLPSYKKYIEKRNKTIFKGEKFYLSPLVLLGKEYGKEDDVWAVGVLLTEVATLLQNKG